MTTQHIGAAGELLVQYQLLKLGIDSARLTTDSGIDLVVYSPVTAGASTVQVKAVLAPVRAGGKGRLAVGWTFPHDCPAQMLAVASLADDLAWIFTLAEARKLAQQRSPKDARRLYWYVDEDTPQKEGVPLKQSDMANYLLTERAPQLFPA